MEREVNKMSDWLVNLVKIDKFGKHPNADSLCITQIYGQNVIFKQGSLQVGDLAVYFPPDTVLPTDPSHPILLDNPGMKPGHVIEAIRLRGIFSNGMLVPAKVLLTKEQLDSIPLDTSVADLIGVTKAQDQGDSLSTKGNQERDYGYMPVYTDIDGYPKYRNKGYLDDKDVVLLEKIHGANGRICFRDGRLWVGSRTQIKAREEGYTDGKERNLWWKVADDMELSKKMELLQNSPEFPENHILYGKDLSKTVLYGEVYGQVQDLTYGLQGARFVVFDSYDPQRGVYNDWDVTLAICSFLGLESVPELYRGPWDPSKEELRFGPSLLYRGHIREGFVVKPLKEQFVTKKSGNSERLIFKFVSEDYKTRKKKKELL